MRWIAKKVYDSKIGRLVREVKPNNILHLRGVYTETNAGVVATGTIEEGYVGYIHSIHVSGNAGAVVQIVNNTSTILPIILPDGGGVVTITSDKPLYVCEAGDVSIVASSGTIAAWVSIIKEPMIIEE
ncbi:MAG: hypothetical protein QXJ25_02290 [Candidatus Aenigmatarchaeota archaeon]